MEIHGPLAADQGFHRHTNTNTHRHTGTRAHRHTDTPTHRHTNTRTHRHTETHTPTPCEFSSSHRQVYPDVSDPETQKRKVKRSCNLPVNLYLGSRWRHHIAGDLVWGAPSFRNFRALQPVMSLASGFRTCHGPDVQLKNVRMQRVLMYQVQGLGRGCFVIRAPRGSCVGVLAAEAIVQL